MHIIMGGAGHVGSATASVLLDRGQAVGVVVRTADRAGSAPVARLRSRGARVFVADAGDAAALHNAFAAGTRALLINPPADSSTDTDAVENRTADVIVDALQGCALEKVVAVSTYGAQPGAGIGDLGTLWRFEQKLAEQSIPVAINRHAYYMTNWQGFVDTAREHGVLPSSFAADFRLPMVAPDDLGEAAADRLLSGVDDVGVVHVEGPERYTPADVAAELSSALKRAVSVQEQPQNRLEEMFASAGFSAAAAASYAEMTRRTIAGFELPEHPRRGRITLREHIIAASRDETPPSAA